MTGDWFDAELKGLVFKGEYAQEARIIEAKLNAVDDAGRIVLIDETIDRYLEIGLQAQQAAQEELKKKVASEADTKRRMQVRAYRVSRPIGVLNAFKAAHNLTNRLQATSKKCLVDFPPSQFFRIAIDTWKLAHVQTRPTRIWLEQGAFTFEIREPGYLAGFLTSFDAMVESFQAAGDKSVFSMADGASHLSGELLRYHDLAVEGVRDEQGLKLPAGWRGADVARGVHFGLYFPDPLGKPTDPLYPNQQRKTPCTATPDGMYRLGTTIAAVTGGECSLRGWGSVEPYGNDDSWRRLRLHPKTARECEDRATDIFSRLLATTGTIEDIAQCVQRLDQAHVFPDGNLRTCQMMLNRLLLDAGEVPCLLWQPNCIDGFDIPTLVRHIRFGQGRWLSYSEHSAADWTKWWIAGDPQNHLVSTASPSASPSTPATAGNVLAASTAANTTASTVAATGATT